MPKSERAHIGIFGRRNLGKSSLINVLSEEDIAIVSDTAGTTTDPVKKVMEITGIGPVILIDTAGVDDEGELGSLRVKKSLDALKTVDMAVLLISENNFSSVEEGLISEFEKYNVPFIVVYNKEDIFPVKETFRNKVIEKTRSDFISFSALSGDKREELISLIKKNMPDSAYNNPTLIGDLVSYGDIVLLITPIDVQAPKGRIILPQVQTIRDLLDNDCVSIVLKEREVDAMLKKTKIKPALAVTDSQVFLKADASVPKDIPLTGFSILFARYKGDFDNYLKGTPKLSKLKDEDNVLILESCSHHVAGDDIGRVKIPRWISDFTGKKINFDVAAGLTNPPKAIEEYALVIQCGGCMLTRKQIINRLKPAVDANVAVTNYGMTIAYVQGVYERAVAPFVKIKEDVKDYL